MTRKAALIALLMAIVAGGCAGMRKVDVGPSSATTYRVDVYNARGGTVTVFYNDGGAERELGTVPAGRTERFIIPSPATTTVTIRARTAGGTTLGPYTVALTAASPARVTIR